MSADPQPLHDQAVSLRVRHRKDYFQALRWFVRDAWLRYRYQTLAIIALGVVASIVRAGAIGIIIRYAQALSNGDPISRFGYTVQPRESFVLLSLIAVSICAVLLAAGAMDYAGAIWAMRLRFKHERYCWQRLMRAISRYAAFPRAMMGLENPMQNLRRASTMDCQWVGRALRQSLDVPPALARVLIYGSIMFVLHWGLTLMLLPLLAVAFYFLVRINRQGMDAMANLHDAIRDGQQQQNKVFSDIVDTQPPKHAVRREIRRLPTHPLHRASIECRYTQSTMTIRSKLVSESLTAGAFLLIIVFFGYAAITGTARWGAMIGYILTARWALTALQQLSGSLTSVNRFAPAVHVYRTVLAMLTQANAPRRRVAEQAKHASPTTEDALIFQAAMPPLTEDSATTWRVPRKGAALLGLSERLDRFSLLHSFSAFKPDEHQIATLLYDTYLARGDARPSDKMTVREFLHLPETEQFDLVTVLEETGIDEPHQWVPNDLDTPVAQLWNSWPERVRLSALAIAAKNTRCRLVVFTQWAAARLNSEELTQLIDFFPDQHVVFVVYPQHLDRFRTTEIENLAVLDNGRVWGIGDWPWYDRHREAIMALGREPQEQHETADSDAELEMMMSG